ncbi:MAG: type II toxin-antitoxin system ParD family antitoxin [Bacteroidota bacterium]
MNVSLPPSLESFVKTLVETGRYSSASEVFRDGLRLLEEREHRRRYTLEELQDLMREAKQSGPSVPLDMEEIKREARQAFEARRPGTS